MKKFILIPLLLVFCVLGLQNETSAQDLNVGYVNPDLVLSRMPEMAAVDRRLQNFRERKQREFVELNNSLEQGAEELERRRSVISAEAVEREERRLADIYMRVVNFEQEYAQQLQQRQAEEMRPLLQKLQAAIDQAATEKGLTYVLNTTTNNGDFIILFASPEMQRQNNITDRVLEILDI